jgi:pimeloyl-ACP methyl ester carboxylesterase
MLPDRVLRAVARSRVGRYLGGVLLYTHPERTTAESVYGDALAMKHASAFFATIRAGLRYNLDASGLAVPTTVAWGTHDRILSHRQSKEARRRLPTAHHVDLPDCGHVPMIDDPSLVVEVIDETVARAVASKAA